MSDKSEDFLSFEKALRELQLRSDELKKLVSEGEIRAYRDGDSMKFRKEDVQSLTARNEGATKLSFVDSLEDDTGMVTEQISEEDTLLAEDDVDETATKRTARVTRGPARVASAAADEPRTPAWVTAVAGLGLALLVWGFFIAYSISQEADPNASPFTSVFAESKK